MVRLKIYLEFDRTYYLDMRVRGKVWLQMNSGLVYAAG